MDETFDESEAWDCGLASTASTFLTGSAKLCALGLMSVVAVAGRAALDFLLGDEAEGMVVGSELPPALVECESDFAEVLGRELVLW